MSTPFGMDVYVLTEGYYGSGVAYTKYNSVSVFTDYHAVAEGDVKNWDGDEVRSQYVRSTSYVLSNGPSENFKVQIATEVVDKEEFDRHERVMEGKEVWKKFKRAGELSDRTTLEAEALGHFFTAVREAIKNDGFVDMRVYPPVARNDFVPVMGNAESERALTVGHAQHLSHMRSNRDNL